MKKYTCKKTVKAKPMTRQEYVDYRGWDIPEGEDGNDDGYLVENLDTLSNHPNHNGYITWVTKDVFDSTHENAQPRVPAGHISDLMDTLIFEYHQIKNLTICLSFLPNGFQIGYGQSACVSPENFDAGIGEMVALDNCKDNSHNKLWELEGYLLAMTGKTSEKSI